MFKMSTIHEHMHSNDYTTAQSLLRWWWCGPAASTRLEDFFQLLHVMDLRTVDHLLKDTPDSVVYRIQIWRIGWPHLWTEVINSWRLSLSLLHGDSVTCTVNGMISVTSVTSVLCHQIRDVHGTQRSKFTSMITIHCKVFFPKKY